MYSKPVSYVKRSEQTLTEDAAIEFVLWIVTSHTPVTEFTNTTPSFWMRLSYISFLDECVIRGLLTVRNEIDKNGVMHINVWSYCPPTNHNGLCRYDPPWCSGKRQAHLIATHVRRVVRDIFEDNRKADLQSPRPKFYGCHNTPVNRTRNQSKIARALNKQIY